MSRFTLEVELHDRLGHAPAEVRLRRALKCIWRTFNGRCIQLRKTTPNNERYGRWPNDPHNTDRKAAEHGRSSNMTTQRVAEVQQAADMTASGGSTWRGSWCKRRTSCAKVKAAISRAPKWITSKR
jgi:hypothetical protein